MIDISKWQEPMSANKVPDIATYVLLRTTFCSDNIIRRNIKGLRPDVIIYYKYDFENDEDIILSESDK